MLKRPAVTDNIRQLSTHPDWGATRSLTSTRRNNVTVTNLSWPSSRQLPKDPRSWVLAP